MIEMPKLPTDSLYKFLAIVGLLFFLASVISPILMTREINKQESEYIRDLELLNLDAKTWEETSKQMDAAAAESKEAHRDLEDMLSPNSKSSLKEIEHKLAEATTAGQTLEEKIVLLKKQVNDWRKQKIEVEYKGNLMKDSRVAARHILTVDIFGGVIGLIMSITGFVLWYKRAQRFEDLVLKKKVEEPKSNIILTD